MEGKLITIPIKPGPFSFLAGLGEAGGQAFSSAERDREKKLREDRDRINQMIMLRQQGLLSPESFASPEAMALYKRIGIPAVSSQPTSNEMSEDVKRRFMAEETTPGFTLPLSGLISGAQDVQVKPTGEQIPIRQRMVAGLPGPLALGREAQAGGTLAAEAAQSQAAVPQAQLQGATATAALPGAGQTVTAEQQTRQDQQFDAVADRVVADLFAKKGKMPTSAEAFLAGQQDPRAQPFGPNLSEPFYGAAIKRLTDLGYEQSTRRIGASARYSTSNQFDDLARVYSMQMQALNEQLMKLPTVMGIQKSDATMFAIAMKNVQEGKPVNPVVAEAAKRYGEYKAKSEQLMTQVNEYQRRLGGVLSPALGIDQQPTAGLPGQTGVTLQDDQINAVVQKMISDRISETQIDQDVKNGLISNATGEAIKQAYRTARTHRSPK